MLQIIHTHPAVYACWFMLYAFILLVLAVFSTERKGKVIYTIAKVGLTSGAWVMILIAAYCVTIQNSVWPY